MEYYYYYDRLVVSVELQRDKMHLRQDEQRNAELEEQLVVVVRLDDETTPAPAHNNNRYSRHSQNPALLFVVPWPLLHAEVVMEVVVRMDLCRMEVTRGGAPGRRDLLRTYCVRAIFRSFC